MQSKTKFTKQELKTIQSFVSSKLLTLKKGSEESIMLSGILIKTHGLSIKAIDESEVELFIKNKGCLVVPNVLENIIPKLDEKSKNHVKLIMDDDYFFINWKNNIYVLEDFANAFYEEKETSILTYLHENHLSFDPFAELHDENHKSVYSFDLRATLAPQSNDELHDNHDDDENYADFEDDEEQYPPSPISKMEEEAIDFLYKWGVKCKIFDDYEESYNDAIFMSRDHVLIKIDRNKFWLPLADENYSNDDLEYLEELNSVFHGIREFERDDDGHFPSDYNDAWNKIY